MISLLNSVQSHLAAQSQAAPVKPATTDGSAQPQAASKTTSASSAAAMPTDTVAISSAAQAALKEVAETPAQTAREANGGDLQAQRLLAKEAAQHLQ